MNPQRHHSLLWLAILAAPQVSLAAQGPAVVTGGKFTPGGQVLFASDFSAVPIGNFPSGLKYLRGPMEVVTVDGVPMLRSSGPAEFIIPLPSPLPQDFTLEFDLVARNSNCCSGEELAFEASPQLNRSAGSAWVSWHHQYTAILGGGQDMGTSTVRFPEDLQAELIGQLAQIQVMVSGAQFKLYTNGRQVYNIPNLVIRRTNVLRVFLGGVDDATGAVYLARVRLATGGGGVVAANPPPPPPAAPVAQPAPAAVPAAAPAPAPPPAPPAAPAPAPAPNPAPAPAPASAPAPTPAPAPAPAPPPPPPPPPAPIGILPAATPSASTTPTKTTSSTTLPTGVTGSGPITRMATTLNDGPPPPTVRVVAYIAGLNIDWGLAPNAVGYTVCRETPPGGPCTNLTPTPILPGVAQYMDSPLLPGATYGYRVTAWQANQHFGISAPVTGTPDSIPAPSWFRVIQYLPATAEVVLQWDSVHIPRSTVGPPPVSYQLLGNTLAVAQLVTGTSARVTLASVAGKNTWSVSAMLPDGSGGWYQGLSTGVGFEFGRYRLVALGARAVQQSIDDPSNADGLGDEVYVAAAVTTADRPFKFKNVTVSRSATFGDVGNGSAFPGRIPMGSASGAGGILTADVIPANLDLSGATPAPSLKAFPWVIWEGALSQGDMVIVHPSIWEEDRDHTPYGWWTNTLTAAAKLAYTSLPATDKAWQSLSRAQSVGPATGTSLLICQDDPQYSYALNGQCSIGQDRPLGMTPVRLNGEYLDRVLVLQQDSFEKLLAGPPPRPGIPSNIIIVPLFEGGVTMKAMYELYLRVERMP